MSNNNPVATDPLNMAEKAFLEENAKRPVEELAAALKRPKHFIKFELKLLAQEKYEQERTPVEKTPEPEKPVETPVTTVKKDSPLLDSFVRRKEGGVVAMSSGAAQLSDEVTKNEEKKPILEARPDCVTTCRK